MLRRPITVLLTAALLVTGTAGAASAAMVDPERTGIDLWTDAYFSSDAMTLTVTADGEFRTNNVANTTIALQVSGTETWTDEFGNTQVAPLTASPVSVQFARANHVEAVFSLHSPNSVVAVKYSAEDAGLAPSLFFGSCNGAVARTSSTNFLVTKDC